MTDLVVTVPKRQWGEWLEEGDCAGTPSTYQEYDFAVGIRKPPIQRGERLYVVAYGKLRGYAPVTGISYNLLTRPGIPTRYYIRRSDRAVACTITEEIRGFRGWRKVWWSREQEMEFPGWQDP